MSYCLFPPYSYTYLPTVHACTISLKMDRYDSKVWLLLVYIHKISILKKMKTNHTSMRQVWQSILKKAVHSIQIFDPALNLSREIYRKCTVTSSMTLFVFVYVFWLNTEVWKHLTNILSLAKVYSVLKTCLQTLNHCKLRVKSRPFLT